MRCSLLIVCGGVHSLIWRMDCPACGNQVDYPSTNYYDDPRP